MRQSPGQQKRIRYRAPGQHHSYTTAIEVLDGSFGREDVPACADLFREELGETNGQRCVSLPLVPLSRGAAVHCDSGGPRLKKPFAEGLGGERRGGGALSYLGPDWQSKPDQPPDHLESDLRPVKKPRARSLLQHLGHRTGHVYPKSGEGSLLLKGEDGPADEGVRIPCEELKHHGRLTGQKR